MTAPWWSVARISAEDDIVARGAQEGVQDIVGAELRS